MAYKSLSNSVILIEKGQIYHLGWKGHMEKVSFVYRSDLKGCGILITLGIASIKTLAVN